MANLEGKSGWHALQALGLGTRLPDRVAKLLTAAAKSYLQKATIIGWAAT